MACTLCGKLNLIPYDRFTLVGKAAILYTKFTGGLLVVTAVRGMKVQLAKSLFLTSLRDSNP